jgi:hypothetical protein
VYAEGVRGTDDTAAKAVTGVNQTRVSNNADGTGGRWNGLIAHVCVWNIALSDANMTALAASTNPQDISPGSIVDYWTLTGNVSPETPTVGADNLTVTGTTFSSDNPTVNAPTGTARLLLLANPGLALFNAQFGSPLKA